MNDIRIFDDAAGLHRAAAQAIEQAAATAIRDRGRFLLVLTGGSTPRGIYERLATHHAERIEWERVHVFWGDERCVPRDDPQSNFRLAAETLLRRVPLPHSNIYRMPGEVAAEQAAERYDAELQRFFGAATPAALGEQGFSFDLVLLGMGGDGHIASLFPGSPALHAESWAAAAEAPPQSPIAERVTLTLPALNRARGCLFLVTGAAKRDTVRAVLDGSAALPAASIRPRGPCEWFLDAGAAGGLEPPG
jgi:6-phosphogluconolactonase